MRDGLKGLLILMEASNNLNGPLVVAFDCGVDDAGRSKQDEMCHKLSYWLVASSSWLVARDNLVVVVKG